MSGVSGSSTPSRDYKDLLAILEPKNLDTVFLKFKELTNCPDDLKCLLLVAANLRRTFKALPAWRKIPPFKGWAKLTSFLVLNADKIQKVFGEVVNPHGGAEPVDDHSKEKHPMWREIGVRPLYAMLCNAHPDTNPKVDLPVRYGALQLQVLHARWTDIQKGVAMQAAYNSQLATQHNANTSLRTARLPGDYARAVRDLSGPTFDGLIEYLLPEQLPEDFCRNPGVEGQFPMGQGFAMHFARITNYCNCLHGPREGTTRASGTRRPRRPSYPDYIDYGNTRFAQKIVSGDPEEPGGEVGQELFIERSLTEEQALDLGLDPQEVGSGHLDVSSEVPGAANREEALQTARATIRSFEIEKPVFAWNSQALRAAELRNSLLPALHQAADDPTISGEDLAAATAIAVAIDTGRDIDRILQLRLESLPKSEFVFQSPTAEDPNGYWSWWAIQPKYRSEVPAVYDQEVQRRDFLRYPATKLVTDLLLKHCKKAKIRSAAVFRTDNLDRSIKQWLGRVDPEKRITLNRLSHLRWNELHQITGGERAIACLVLGVPQTSASVELHYAMLRSQEALDLFEESSRRMWGADYVPPAKMAARAPEDTYVGCRAFPSIESVKKVVKELKNNSRRFFRVEPSEFETDRIPRLLNDAVLYLVWHQFFSFGTRAIRDAYQEMEAFAESRPVGVLSDKDFVDGYKTRIIWADRNLLDHMVAVQARLKAIAKIRRLTTKLPKSSVWLLDDKGHPLPITPTSIRDTLGHRFPFPVNTPRKVIRYLLRVRGVSHEHAEAYMGHWSHGREPWSPYSSFDYSEFITTLKTELPLCLEMLGFNWVPGGAK